MFRFSYRKRGNVPVAFRHMIGTPRSMILPRTAMPLAIAASLSDRSGADGEPLSLLNGYAQSFNCAGTSGK